MESRVNLCAKTTVTTISNAKAPGPLGNGDRDFRQCPTHRSLECQHFGCRNDRSPGPLEMH